MDVKEILAMDADTAVALLKKKDIALPAWADLEKQYDPKLHDVKTDPTYHDIASGSEVQRVTKVTLGWQRLAVRRMTELMFAVPVKRVYQAKTDEEKTVAKIMESIFKKARINSVNIDRGRSLFASCESLTLWFAQQTDAIYAGETSPIKLRCRTFSPMNGDTIYPLFDEYDDMVALSVEYKRTEDGKTVVYFDTYTQDAHIRYVNRDKSWQIEQQWGISIGKIPGVYIKRNTPIWEDQSDNVTELEWTWSRNGNFLRKNSRPTWVVYSDDDLIFGDEDKKETASRNVLQYGKDSKAEYVTWQQATESLSLHTKTLKDNFFMELQLPDMSMENMKATPMSGEARKMMFIDAQLKVGDESGAWLEMLDREINIVRAFMKAMFPQYESAIDSLEVECEITPFNISVESETIGNLIQATGGKAIMSQQTAIAYLGYADDVDEEFERIKEDTTADVFAEPTE